MDVILRTIMNGRVLRQLVAFTRERLLPWGIDEPNQNIPEGEQGEEEDLPFQDASSQPPQSGADLIPDAYPINLADSATKTVGSDQVVHSDANPSNDILTFVPMKRQVPPPLAARYLQIFPFKDQYDQTSSAMSLTKSLIWNLNVILKCEPVIAKLEKQAADFRLEQEKVAHMTADVQRVISEAQDRSADLADLEELNEVATSLQEEQDLLSDALKQKREELRTPRKQFFTELKRVLVEYELLESATDEDGNERVPWNAPQNVPASAESQEDRHSPTASEIAANNLEIAKEEAIERIQAAELQLQGAQQRVEEWNRHYNEELREYCHYVEQGDVDTTKSEFDMILLTQEREATRAYVEADEALEAVKDHAYALGLIYQHSEQASRFADHVDDGYHESMEAEMVENVDRTWIETWLHEGKNEPSGGETEVDDWDAKTVGLSDSVSVVAEGKERKRIDRWQAMCELVEVDMEAEAETEAHVDSGEFLRLQD